MTGILMSQVFVFLGGLGIGIGLGWFVWRRRRRHLEDYIQRIELSREDKVDRYQASVQRLKEREAKIGELRKEIFHKERIIRDLSRRLEGQNLGRNDQASSWTPMIY